MYKTINEIWSEWNFAVANCTNEKEKKKALKEFFGNDSIREIFSLAHYYKMDAPYILHGINSPKAFPDVIQKFGIDKVYIEDCYMNNFSGQLFYLRDLGFTKIEFVPGKNYFMLSK